MQTETIPRQPAPVPTSRTGILTIVLVYAGFAAWWTLLADKLVEMIFGDPDQIMLANMLKDWLYVGVTSWLLYRLMHRLCGAGAAPKAVPAGFRRLGLPFVALAVVIVSLTGAGIVHTLAQRKEPAIAPFQLEQSTLYADAVWTAAWIGFAGLMALFIVGSGFYVLRQGRQLALALAVQQSQAERLRALRLLASIADSSNDAIYAKDLEGRYILFNQAASDFIGKPVEDVLGRDDRDLFPAEQAEMLMAIDSQVIAGNCTHTQEELLATADGERVFSATKGPLHDNHGKVIGLFGISRDITVRKTAEDSLRREHDRNQRYLDTVQTLMVALDGEGRITMINRTGCDLLGYTEGELLGRNWFETCLPQPEGMAEVFPVFRRIMAGDLKAAEYCENAVLCRDGRQRWIAWHNANLTDDAGRVIGTLSSGEDISERKAAEEALRLQTVELAQRNAELERFNRAMVGRELDMIALKQQVNELSRQLGQAPPYPLVFLDASAAQPNTGEAP